MALSLPDQLNQLEAARKIVLGDAGLYPQIVSGILPIVGANARPELRRWGAEFLAETFASPAFTSALKENSAVGILGTLKDLLEIPGEDAGVVKNVVQTAASIYTYVFRYMYVWPHSSPRRQATPRLEVDVLGEVMHEICTVLLDIVSIVSQIHTMYQCGIKWLLSNRIF